MPEAKEKLIQESGSMNQESEIRKQEQKTGIKDVEARAEVPQEVKTWLQRIEEDPTQMKKVIDDTGQTVLQPVAAADPRVMVPTTRNKFVAGFKKSVEEAGRWLSTFVLRLIKIKRGKVKFEK